MRQKSEVRTTRILAALTGWLDVRWVIALILALAGSASVGAQEYRGTAEQRMACAGDVFKLCFSEIPNVSRIVGCLERQKHQLSAGCRAVFENSNVRVAYDRWQRRRHHLASAADRSRSAPVQAERRDEASTVASNEPETTGSVPTAKDTHAVSAARGTGLRSKRAVRDLQRRSKVAHRGSHRRYKTALRHSRPKHRVGHQHLNRYAFTFGKQYRYHYQQHSVSETKQSDRVARVFGKAKD
jgi:hypothetical protein